MTLEFGKINDLPVKLPAITSYLEETLSRVEVLEKEQNRCRLFLKFEAQKKANLQLEEEKAEPEETKLLKVLEWLNNVEDVKI